MQITIIFKIELNIIIESIYYAYRRDIAISSRPRISRISSESHHNDDFIEHIFLNS